MAKPALTDKTILNPRNRRKVRVKTTYDKVFDDLTGNEKDDLLKQIALRLGMINPDPEE